jgi:hypothetical protein
MTSLTSLNKGSVAALNFLEVADWTPFIYIHKVRTVIGRLMYSTELEFLNKMPNPGILESRDLR